MWSLFRFLSITHTHLHTTLNTQNNHHLLYKDYNIVRKGQTIELNISTEFMLSCFFFFLQFTVHLTKGGNPVCDRILTSY